MNRTYALVWNHALRAWSVAHEHARRRGKGAGAVLAAALLLPLTAMAADLPTGGQVVAGQGQIGTPSANQMVIDQASNKLAIDWQSFDIGKGNKVTFNQPGSDSIALNRVLGADGSKIMGQLDANGRVFIVNPNGVLFGQGAQVNVGGLVASTLDISNSDFEAGNYRFKGDGNNASVINNGQITAADGGAVALLGGTVSNNGVIVANQGSVALAAGNKVTLDFAGDGLLNVQVDEAVVDALVENHKLIKADGGQVLLTADAGEALLKTVVNNTGVIEAQTLGEKDGKIVLLGSFDGGSVQVAGTLDASAPDGGDGGFIETSGAHVKVADSAKVTTKAANGKTGTWLIDPNDFTIAATGGDMTGAAVSTAVQNNNFEIQTATMGTAGGNGDIHVNDAITWNSGNTLTLNAERNINVNSTITAQHANGKVALKYGQASTDGGTADYSIKAPINLQSGQNFSTQKGNTGATITYTVVNDAQALQNMNNNLDGNYAVGSNLDLAGIANWQPVGNSQNNAFRGRLDGLGHTLSNLAINQTDTMFVGLFGVTGSSSVIRNIGLIEGSIFGSGSRFSYSGALVGYNAGNIGDVYATGSVSSQGGAGISGSGSIGGSGGYSYSGGLVGYNNSGTINNAYATGSVSSQGGAGISGSSIGGSGGQSYSGGLVGYNNSGTINNAYATGSVSGQGGDAGDGGSIGGSGGNSHSGGLIGSSNSGTINNAYATGNVSSQGGANGAGGSISGTGGYSHSGGLAGSNNTSTINNAYWDASSTGQGQGIGYGSGAPISVDASTRYNHSAYSSFGTWAQVNGTSNVYAASDANGVQWIMIEGQTRPFLASEYSTSIGNAHQLQLMAYNQGANYTLARDIDASATAGSNASGMWSTAGFDPIGNSGNTFSGSLDGQGHTISGLAIDRSSDNVGLFGTTANGSTIRNLGLLGGSVTSTGNNIGALVGSNFSSLNNVYAMVNVSGNDRVGGLVGNNRGLIDSAYATGNVIGRNDVGGLAGHSEQNIINTYASGNVTGDYYVGGLVGYNGARIDDSYATGSVNDGPGERGGLVGLHNGGGGVVRSFYAITDANGNSINNAGVSSGAFSRNNLGTGKAWGELSQASTFAGWSLASAGGTSAAWRIYEGHSGPLLRGLLKSLTITVDDVAGKTYDATNSTVAGVSHSLSDSSANLQGSASYTSVSTRNAGTYDLGLTGFYSNQQGYDIEVVEGSYIIDKADLTVTGISALNKTYDGSRAAGLSGTAGVTALGTDIVSVSGTGVGIFADKNAGQGKDVTVTGYTLTGPDAGNYNVVQPTGLTATISKADLAVTGINASDKIYDGSRDVTLSGTASVTALGTDSVSVSGTGTGTFADKNAGVEKKVTVTGYTLSGDDAGNYNVVQPTNLTANIGKADLAVTGISAANKTYDSTLTATLTGTASVTAIGTDSVSVSGTGTGTFADKNVGQGKDVTVTGYTLTGDDAGNYNVVQPTNLTANITKASISAVTGITSSNKTYDGTTDASLNTSSARFTDRLGNDDLTVASASGAFTNKNAGDGKTVNISGITLGGDDAGNYTLVSTTASTTADIAKANIDAVTGITAGNRTYDGTTDASLNTGSAGFTGLIGNDDLTVASASGAFANKNAADGKTVNISGITLGGDDAGNYTLVSTTASTTADIAKANISAVTGITAENRTYDGTTDASLNIGNAAFTGRFGDDDLTVTSASGAFTNKNASDGKTVNITGITLGGDDAGNYTLADDTASATADIAKAALTVTANDASKIYDGQAFSGGNGVRYDGFVNAENASALGGSLNYGGTAQNATNAGNYVLSASGLSSGNYAIIYADGSLAIGKATLTVTANDASKTYDGQAFSGGNGVRYDGFVNNETSAVLGGTLSYGGSAQGATDAGNYVLSANGLTSDNYAISYTDGALQIIAAVVEPTPVEPGPAEPTPVEPGPTEPSPVGSSQPYVSVLASNSHTVSNEPKQQAQESKALTQDMLVTNPIDERLNLQVINQGIRLPEGI